MKTQEQINELLTSIFFHAHILDELVTEMPDKVVSHIRKTQKVGATNKLFIKENTRMLMRNLKGITDVSLFYLEERETQEYIKVIEFLRSCFIDCTIDEAVEYANLIYEHKKSKNDNTTTT